MLTLVLLAYCVLRPLEMAFGQVESARLVIMRPEGLWAGNPQRLSHGDTIVINAILQMK